MSRNADCTQYRLAASAQLDGEDGSGLLVSRGLPPLESHLPVCPACTSWVASATRVNRRLRIGLAEFAPDLTQAIVAAIAAEPAPAPQSQRSAASMGAESLPAGSTRRRRRLIVAIRVALVVAALGQLALAVPSLFFGEFAMQSAIHVARETGAWNLALAVGFAAAALHPRLAAGLATMLGAFICVLVAITLFDLGAGHVHLDRAASHLVAISGLVLIIGLVRATSDRRPAPGSAVVAAHRDLRPDADTPASTNVQVDTRRDEWLAAA